MKYVHGTDKKHHDLWMIWGNRVVIVFLLSVFLFLLWFSTVIAKWAFTGDPESILFLAGLILFLGAFPFALYEGVWRNAKYSLDETGITIVNVFRSKHYPWSAFQSVFVKRIYRGGGGMTGRDYIILMIRECGALVGGGSPTLSRCWKDQDKFLVVRCTEERLREFGRYRTISEPPAPKPWKYFD